MQAERGSSWIPGLRDNTTGTQNIPGPPSFMTGQMGPPSQPPRPPAVSSVPLSTVLQFPRQKQIWLALYTFF